MSVFVFSESLHDLAGNKGGQNNNGQGRCLSVFFKIILYISAQIQLALCYLCTSIYMYIRENILCNSLKLTII